MGKIRVLDEHVANLIAAGEVVERPASVVKELIENAIDAAADVIEIEIEEGGLQFIRVKDNGDGMDAADVAAAFQRHATSKINDGRDLQRIHSLGFRGEALPSIASVARVECITSPDDSGLGSRIVIEGGRIERHEDVNATKGTVFVVRDLFYNTPARLKYMKTIQTELNHVSDFIYRIALARPNITFCLVHNGKTLVKTPGNGDLRQAAAAIYGTSAAKNMLEVAHEHADFRLCGLIGKPEITRSNRYGMTTIVNGRHVRSYALANAILSAYHTLLPIHRFPLAIIDLEMDPLLVDVNVHPAKLEVRLSKEAELVQFVQSTLSSTLMGTNLIPSVAPAKEKPVHIQEQLAFYPQSGASSAKKPTASPRIFTEQTGNWHRALNVPDSTERMPERVFPELHPIGQLHGTYILAQNDDGLYVIDQHAAHERINYEYFYERFGRPLQESQQLLVPAALELTSSEAVALGKNLAVFARIGVMMEPFGGNTFIIRSVPEWIPKGEEVSIVEEMAQWVIAEKSEIDVSAFREKSAILCACKASIKANDRRGFDEMQALLEQLGTCSNPFTCPHGRPILISFSKYELAKMFKRVM